MPHSANPVKLISVLQVAYVEVRNGIKEWWSERVSLNQSHQLLSHRGGLCTGWVRPGKNNNNSNKRTTRSHVIQTSLREVLRCSLYTRRTPHTHSKDIDTENNAHAQPSVDESHNTSHCHRAQTTGIISHCHRAQITGI